MSAAWVRRVSFYAALVLVPVLAPVVRAADATPEQVEFFEKRIRPVLAKSCYTCHSRALSSPMGGLRVDSRDGIARVVEPGDPEASRLFQALSYRGPLKMPPSGKLPDEQISDFAAWIKMGAPDPRIDAVAKKSGIDLAEGRKFWCFQPVTKTVPPNVNRADWVRSPVDAFVLAKLEAAGLQPAAPADKRTLIRRVTFDLTGLPPSPEEVVAFLLDESPDAYRRVVDRLLASQHYGERWARHWLDLVRYSETNGHEFDNDKLAPWRYRDYVIRAFNDDLPYDQFIREHLAGDLLPAKRTARDGMQWESPLGTSYFWFGEVLNSATDSVKSRADEVDNQIDVTGKAFLGLTVACARCHDHKFDPIPTADYYALAGVMQSTDLREAALDTPEESSRLLAISSDLRAIDARVRALIGAPQHRKAVVDYRPEDRVFENFEGANFGNWSTSGIAFGEVPLNGAANSLAAGSERFAGTLTSPKFRTDKTLYLHVRLSGTKSDPDLKEHGPLRFTSVCDGYKGQHLVPSGGAAEWKTLTLTLERERTCYYEIVDHSRDGHITVEQIVFSTLKTPPPTHAERPDGVAGSLSGGVVSELERLARRRAELENAIPESAFAMLAADYQPHDVRVHLRGNYQNLGDVAPRRFLQVIAGESQPPVDEGSGRLQIADWIASRRNPLTARVMVNRIWKHHFGRGIVGTPDNFGVAGDRPTHPELLDYLASRFVESGWSIKAMHREILLSSAYQMSSAVDTAAAKIDPQNKLLHHMPVRRLEAEAVRDALLAVSGALKPELYGPSVAPHISRFQDGRGKPKSGPLDGDGRRSIYIQVRRNFLTPMLLAFDYPLPISAMGARGSSTVPSQALLLMNNEFVAQQAELWAKRAAAMAAGKPQERIRFFYETAFARPPEPFEIDEILAFVRKHPLPERAWTDVAHVLINLPEFIYLR